MSDSDYGGLGRELFGGMTRNEWDPTRYGYKSFQHPKYKGKGHGKLRISQCKDSCKRDDFPLPILMNKAKTADKGAGRMLIYTSRLKSLGLAKCKQCIYICAEPLPKGTRCPCCGRILSYAIHHTERTNSKYYVEPKRIE